MLRWRAEDSPRGEAVREMIGFYVIQWTDRESVQVEIRDSSEGLGRLIRKAALGIGVVVGPVCVDLIDDAFVLIANGASLGELF